ncbi:MAG: pyruvate dehydrogenase (acetyl-transferring) E1 component subunit alpha [Chlamydiales bacterium]
MTSPYFSPTPNSSPEEVSDQLIKQLGKERVIEALKWMLLIRHFEVRGESAYQHGLVGGFYHAYSGQESIQVAAVQAFGLNNWYIGFYRCHALALLLGATPNELMAELYGRATGNAKGRGGSMHLYAERMLGGFAIVGGHLPIAAGAAFSLKYLNRKDELAICFLGEGAVAQGAFHETLNLASLWNLPVIFIIENNQWGMGTHVNRAISATPIAEKQAPSYGMKGYTLNGMDYFNCYAGFEHIYREVLETSRPVLIECVCERFSGHSISDPGFYRSKEELKKVKEQDPIAHLQQILEKKNLIDENGFKAMDKEAKETVIAAMKFAEESPWPSPTTLEEEVYAE